MAAKAKLKMVYWKSNHFWLGRLVDHPEMMTQGKTLKELEANMRDAYRMMLFDDLARHIE
jgi:predicted RNase H-like HicB family nuclease